MSDHDPAASLAVSLDQEDGFFAGAGASVAVGTNSLRIANASQYAGFAKRLDPVSVEVGLIHRTYDRLADTDYQKDFFEAYVGFTHKAVKVRLYVSPNYRRDSRTSYYTEINARLLTVGKWSLDGHGGLSLIPYDLDDQRGGLQSFKDWRVQASRPIGPLFVSIGVAGTNYPVYSSSGRARAFGTISYAF